MNIERLHYFVDSAELENFSAAASKNYISQTAISKQVHRLEAELNSQLFTIENNKIQLTEAGRFLYNRAKLILSDLDTVAIETRQLANDQNKILRIGFTTTFEAQTASRLLLKIDSAMGPVHYLPVQQTYQQNREELLRHTLDLVIAVDYGMVRPPADAKLACQTLMAGEMLIAASQVDPISSLTRVQGTDIQDRTIGFYNFDGTTGAPVGMVPTARQDGYPLTNIQRFDRLEELLLNVSLGNCLTFVPEGFRYDSYENLVYRHIQNTTHRYQLQMVYDPKNDRPSLLKVLAAIQKAD
ncbi:LysR family transcriptional regulator [Secundilactobacillus kimchicus]|uniref:LysR family transcriptional regulator n=1 Tax=Secundilactobacillus kimchicus TaxID=528209 RepID=UPI001C00E529|nr:LysR family transcriptional regulator [Secundilactobacillus kimchicus]MBT9672596.1 LysR family transcriptional regulator [Secundilactobacillus kimchicus]